MFFKRLPTSRQTVRIFVKAFLLLFVINLICLKAEFDPIASLTKMNLWWLTGHGRERLVYKGELTNGQLPIESLLATHEITFKPKGSEYRVIILGNSGPYGAAVTDQDTLSAQLNAKALRVNGKRLVAYNLAYPNAGIIESTLTLDAALKYQPDLVILFVTGNSFNNAPTLIRDNAFLSLNRARLEQITTTFGMKNWFEAHAGSASSPSWYSWFAFHDQGTLPVWLGSLFYPFVSPDYGLTGWRIANDPIPAKPNNFEDVSGALPISNDTWNFLSTSNELALTAHAKLLIVNQPTLVLKNNVYSQVSYSRLYGRDFYDHYRDVFSEYCASSRLWCADFWNVVDPEYYTDSELHIDGHGWSIVADRLIQLLFPII